MEKLPKSKLTKRQTKTITKNYTENGVTCQLAIKTRYDDECGNGHNSFAITADLYENKKEIAGGCLHDEIKKHAPELAHLIKWHLCSSDGPIHYIANALYYANDTDHDGLKKGEFSSFEFKVKVKDKCVYTSRVFYNFRNWLFRGKAKKETNEFFKMIKPELYPKIVRVGSGSPSEGKPSDLEAARSCAIWPEAALSDFTKEKLTARLPLLLREFKATIEQIGFVY